MHPYLKLHNSFIPEPLVALTPEKNSSLRINTQDCITASPQPQHSTER